MNPANVSPGASPAAPHAPSRRSSEIRARPDSSPRPNAPPPTAATQHGRWGRCDEDTPASSSSAHGSNGANESAEEPRTGVIRRVTLRSQPSTANARPAAEQTDRHAQTREPQPNGVSGEWRCLEAWRQPSQERRARRSSKVTIVQLSRKGDLLRQNGPDTWLPEAGDFVQRMSHLLAQGLGFERCRSICLKGASSVLTVTEAGDSKVVAVSGPVRSMSNVLRRAGIE